MHLKQILKTLTYATILAICLNGLYRGFSAFWWPRSEPLTLNYDVKREFREADAHTTAITSAYSKAETCPTTDCITANGELAQAGRTVACPRDIPFGTLVLVQDKIYTCTDRTAKKYNGRYDIYLGDTEQAWLMAKEYGLKKELIKIYY